MAACWRLWVFCFVVHFEHSEEEAPFLSTELVDDIEGEADEDEYHQEGEVGSSSGHKSIQAGRLSLPTRPRHGSQPVFNLQPLFWQDDAGM